MEKQSYHLATPRSDRATWLLRCSESKHSQVGDMNFCDVWGTRGGASELAKTEAVSTTHRAMPAVLVRIDKDTKTTWRLLSVENARVRPSWHEIISKGTLTPLSGVKCGRERTAQETRSPSQQYGASADLSTKTCLVSNVCLCKRDGSSKMALETNSIQKQDAAPR
jgi:hypothetical protein